MMLDFILLLPELIVALSGILLLMMGVFAGKDRVRYLVKIQLLVLLGVLIGLSEQWGVNTTIFGNLLVLDNFGVMAKMTMVVATMLVLLLVHGSSFTQSWITFETIVLSQFALLGMMLMVSANHLLSFYVALELMSLSLYILAASNRDTILSSEAGLKYFVLGALASGLFLFGCSLVYGFSSTADFTQLSTLYTHSTALPIGVLLGIVLILVALCFKMSAAPFHMWVPDVYQGAPTVITAFFASAPKVAALVVTLRFLMQPLLSIAPQWQQITVAVAVLSMIVGAVAALRQTNIKRLLAYSSIGHVGYVLVGISSGNVGGIQSVLLYLAIYVVMTVGAFGVILQLKRDKKPAEDLDDLKGLATKHPLVAVVMSIFMLSMAGIPPFSGFFGKFYVFLSAMEEELYAVAVIGVLSSVIAAFYYLKIIKLMYFDEAKLSLDTLVFPRAHSVLIGITTTFTLLFFLYPTPLIQVAREAARSLIK